MGRIRSTRFVFALLAASLAGGCSDNATKLSFAIEDFASSSTPSASAGEVISYTPKSDPDLPYYLVFFPEHRVDREDVEAAGLPSHLAVRIFAEMGYLSIGNAPFLVVVQDGGELNFTTHWSRFASVPEVLVVPGRGTTSISLTPGERGVVVEAIE